MRSVRARIAVLAGALLLGGCDLGCSDHGLCTDAPRLPRSADLLPLERGLYVAAGRVCKGASNADQLAYWGGGHGINSAKASCTIRSVRRSGPAHALDQRCSAIAGGLFDESVELTILNRTSFAYRGDASRATGDQAYRHCGARWKL